MPKALPLGELPSGARLRGLALPPLRRRFHRKQARHPPLAVKAPSVKMQCRAVRRPPGIALLKLFSAIHAQSARGGHSDLLHPDFLRRPGNGRKQSHQPLFVHLAAVAGEGVVAALHAEGKHGFTQGCNLDQGEYHVHERDFFHGRN